MLNIPAGYKLVPIEPTETMVVCGFESRPDPVFSKPEDWEAFAALTGCQQAAHKARLCYAAMLDAAPTPPSVAPGDAQDGDRMTVLYVAGAICRHLDMALDQSKVMAAARDIAQHIAAPAAGDALDAARYRWLRDNIQEDHSLPGSFWLSDTGGESWDKTIDAAMAYQRQQGEAA